MDTLTEQFTESRQCPKGHNLTVLRPISVLLHVAPYVMAIQLIDYIDIM